MSRFTCECTSQQRPNHTRYPPYSADDACESRALREGHRLGDDDQRAGEDACATDAGNRASYDESHGARACAANRGTDFECRQGADKCPLDREQGVEGAEEELEAAGCEEKRAAIPADILDAVELGCDGWNGGGYDGLILLWFLLAIHAVFGPP